MNRLFDQTHLAIDSIDKNGKEEYKIVAKDKCYLGFDPGKSGGVVAMVGDTIVGKWIMPILGDDLDVIALSDIITSLLSDYNVTAIVEDVHSIYGTSSGSNFTFGYVCGQINAVVKVMRLKVIEIQPKFWQKQIWTNSDMVYKPKKPDQKKASIDTKATSLCAAKRLFPNEDLRGEITVKYYGDNANNRKLKRVGKEIPSGRSEHDGIVDALLLAECARRLNY